jgi:hypothetical protein
MPNRACIRPVSLPAVSFELNRPPTAAVRLGAILSWLHSLLSRPEPRPLREWFRVRWDEESVHLAVAPPGRAAWAASFTWASVTRVCFTAEEVGVSDSLYVFTAERAESYAVPIEAEGGAAFWAEILRRGLFDAELAITAASSGEGTYCWPPAPPAPTGTR